MSVSVVSLLARFAGVGAAATALQYLIMIALVELSRLPPVPASTIGFVLSAVFNYAANHRLTFASTASHRAATPKFVLVSGIGLLINSGCMHLLTQFSALPYLVAQLISSGLVLAWSFNAHRFWTFQSHS